MAVALMRLHRGSLVRQSSLSSALVRAMGSAGGGGLGGGGGGGGDDHPAGAEEGVDGGGGEAGGRAGGGGEVGDSVGVRRASTEGGANEKGEGPLVSDPWFQLVLCRECMLHGFYRAAEAGLKQVRDRGCGGGGRGGGAAVASDTVWVWTEVLGKVSAAEAVFGSSSDPVSSENRFLGWK